MVATLGQFEGLTTIVEDAVPGLGVVGCQRVEFGWCGLGVGSEIIGATLETRVP